jgi:hypothetical protein
MIAPMLYCRLLCFLETQVRFALGNRCTEVQVMNMTLQRAVRETPLSCPYPFIPLALSFISY